jgi:hypothetical protein
MGKTMKRKKEGIYQKNQFITRKKMQICSDLSNKYPLQGYHKPTGPTKGKQQASRPEKTPSKLSKKLSGN